MAPWALPDAVASVGSLLATGTASELTSLGLPALERCVGSKAAAAALARLFGDGKSAPTRVAACGVALLSEGEPNEQLRLAFQVCDADDDGLVSLAELRAVVQAFNGLVVAGVDDLLSSITGLMGAEADADFRQTLMEVRLARLCHTRARFHPAPIRVRVQLSHAPDRLAAHALANRAWHHGCARRRCRSRAPRRN